MSHFEGSVKENELNPRGIVLCVGFAAFLFQFEAFFVHIALPDLQRELGATLDQVTRVMTVYLAGAILALLPAGFLGRVIGFGRTFILGSWIAVLSVAFCGFVDSLKGLWLLRFVQGSGIGLMVAAGYTIIPMWVERERWGWGFGRVSQGAGLGMILGLPAGGVIAHFLSWHWIFLSQIPMVLGLALFAIKTLPRDCRPQGSGVIVPSGFSQIFSLSAVRSSFLSLIFFHALMSGARFLAPFYMASALGLNSLHSSAIMLFYALGFVFSAGVSGRLSDREGPGFLLSLSYVLGALGCFSLAAFSQFVSVAGAVVMVLLLGISTGLFSPSNNRLLMSGIPPECIQTMGAMLPIAINLGVFSGMWLFQEVFDGISGGSPFWVEIAQKAGILFSPFVPIYLVSGLFFLIMGLTHRQVKLKSAISPVSTDPSRE